MDWASITENSRGYGAHIPKTQRIPQRTAGSKTLNPRGLYAIGATEGVLGVSVRTIKNGRARLDQASSEPAFISGRRIRDPRLPDTIALDLTHVVRLKSNGLNPI